MFELKFFIFPQSLHRITSIRPVSSFEIPSYSSFISEPGSVVGIVTGYGLDGPGIESRWGARFSAPVQTALGPTQPPVQLVPGLSHGVKSVRGVTLTPHLLLVPWSRKIRAIPLLPLWAFRPVPSLSACKRVNFTLLFFINHPIIQSSFFLDFLSLEAVTDRLSPKRQYGITTLRCVIFQKSADLNYVSFYTDSIVPYGLPSASRSYQSQRNQITHVRVALSLRAFNLHDQLARTLIIFI